MTEQQRQDIIEIVVSTVMEQLAEVEEEETCAEDIPQYLVTINGEVVTEPVADDQELTELIEEVNSVNPNAEIEIYELV